LSICAENPVSCVAQIHGHMGLKMFHTNGEHKDKRYSRLGILYFLITLSFEGVVPTKKIRQLADF
jgi:hypothetical protein